MTDYSIYDIGHAEGWVHAHLKVGKRDRLERIVLTREQAWRLSEQLTSALRATESGAP